MPRFVIERNVNGVERLNKESLKKLSAKSNAVLKSLGPEIQWVQSYVTEGKLYCVYIAPSAELILEHAKRGGFPADRVAEVPTVLDPTWGEGVSPE